MNHTFGLKKGKIVSMDDKIVNTDFAENEKKYRIITYCADIQN